MWHTTTVINPAYSVISAQSEGEILLEGLCSVELFDSLRRTGHATLKALITVNAVQLTPTFNVPGIYADLGLQGSELTRNDELYIGSAFSLTRLTRKGGDLTGIARRVHQHEEVKYRSQPRTMDTFRYRLGYKQDLAHTYALFWTLSKIMDL